MIIASGLALVVISLMMMLSAENLHDSGAPGHPDFPATRGKVASYYPDNSHSRRTDIEFSRGADGGFSLNLESTDADATNALTAAQVAPSGTLQPDGDIVAEFELTADAKYVELPAVTPSQSYMVSFIPAPEEQYDSPPDYRNLSQYVAVTRDPIYRSLPVHFVLSGPIGGRLETAQNERRATTTPEIEVPKLCEDAALSYNYTPRDGKSAVCVPALDSSTTTTLRHTDEAVDVNYTNVELPDDARLSWPLDTHRVGGIGQQYRALYTELNEAAVGSDNLFWSAALIGLAAAICPIGATVIVSGCRKLLKARGPLPLSRVAAEPPGDRRLGVAGHARRPDLVGASPTTHRAVGRSRVWERSRTPVVWVSWMEDEPVERHLFPWVPVQRGNGLRSDRSSEMGPTFRAARDHAVPG
ncbi:hypothetical protein ACR9E3_30050 [Actinomycetospora sp. C-140]